ncbi:hypothetical protein TWF281_011201 [Arthrobotrys megalospora]
MTPAYPLHPENGIEMSAHPSQVPNKVADAASLEIEQLEEAFTTECKGLLTMFSLKPASYHRIRRLIEVLGEKAEQLDESKRNIAARGPVIPTLEDVLPKLVREPPYGFINPPPSSSGISTMSYRYESDDSESPVPIDPEQGSKTYQIPNRLPRRPFYLPILGTDQAKFYFGPRDAMGYYPRIYPWSAFGAPSDSQPAGSGRQLRFDEVPARFVLEEDIFEAWWSGWRKGERIADWCGDVENHRRGFTNPNKATNEEVMREPPSCVWWEELDYDRMEALDRANTPVQLATGPPVLIWDELSEGLSDAGDRPKLMGDNIPEGGIVVRPSELQTYLDQFAEKIERRMEQLVEEVRVTVAAQTTQGPYGEISPASLPAMIEDDGSSACRASESGPSEKPGEGVLPPPMTTTPTDHSGNQPRVSSDLFKDWAGGVCSEGNAPWLYQGEPEEGSPSQFSGVLVSITPEPMSITDRYDGHLSLGFEPLSPAITHGTKPLSPAISFGMKPLSPALRYGALSAIPPRSAWPLRGAAIKGDDLIAL